jgi:hypothetical protein
LLLLLLMVLLLFSILQPTRLCARIKRIFALPQRFPATTDIAIFRWLLLLLLLLPQSIL